MKINQLKPILYFNDNSSIRLFAKLNNEFPLKYNVNFPYNFGQLKLCHLVSGKIVSLREWPNCFTKGVSTVQRIDK